MPFYLINWLLIGHKNGIFFFRHEGAIVSPLMIRDEFYAVPGN
jgi:hypothetical protein